MITVLEKAIEKAKQLSKEQQEYVAQVIEEMAAEGNVYKLTDQERALVREGLAELDRGEYASDAEVEALLRRPWK